MAANCPVCNEVYPFSEIEMHVEICLSQASDSVTQHSNIRNSNPQLHANKWTDPDPYQLDTDDSLDDDYQQLLSSINNIYGRKEASIPDPQPSLEQEPSEQPANKNIAPTYLIIPNAVIPDEPNTIEDYESYYELELRGSIVQEILDLVGDNQRATAAEQLIKHMRHAWQCANTNAEWIVDDMPELVADLIRKYVTTRSDWQAAMNRLKDVQLTNKNLGIFNVLPQELVYIIFNQTSASTLCKLSQCSKDMKEISSSDIIWREQFAKDFKSTKKIKEDQMWKQNYREAYGVEMNGTVTIVAVRPVRWIYSHSTRSITKNAPGSLPQRFTLKPDNRITGGNGHYFWSNNNLRSVGINSGNITFIPDTKSFQGFVNGGYCWWHTRVVKEFPVEWNISKFSGRVLRMTVTGFVPIPLLAFVCYATALES
jgi:hypothetical protein